MAVMSFFHNPHRFMAGSKWPAWGFTILGIVLVVTGFGIGFFRTPEDFQQDERARMMFVHVPAMWLCMFAYAFMVGASFISFVWRHALADVAAKSAAPIGAVFTAIGLITGSIWGYATWGTWWVWDARLTSELVLLFLYFGFLSLHASIDDVRKADRSAALLAIVGVVNVPIIYFSVKWWNTLHQGASVSLTQGSKMAEIMLQAMLIMAVAFWLYAIAIALYRVRSMILMRERHAQWVADLPEIKAQFKRTSP
jgi:heme exporter protein C